MAIKWTNNASTTLASSISAVATTITVASSGGSLFPSLGTGDYFYATLVDSSNNLEIVKVTARTGDVMTVVRGQEGTSANSYVGEISSSFAQPLLDLLLLLLVRTSLTFQSHRAVQEQTMRLMLEQISTFFKILRQMVSSLEPEQRRLLGQLLPVMLAYLLMMVMALMIILPSITKVSGL